MDTDTWWSVLLNAVSTLCNVVMAVFAWRAYVLAQRWRNQKHEERVAEVASEFCTVCLEYLGHLAGVVDPRHPPLREDLPGEIWDEGGREKAEKRHFKELVAERWKRLQPQIDRLNTVVTLGRVHLRQEDYSVGESIVRLTKELRTACGMYFDPSLEGPREPGVLDPFSKEARDRIESLKTLVVAQVSPKARYVPKGMIG